MRFIIAYVAAVALIATVNAGIVLGPCPNITTLPYDTRKTTRINHYLLAVDKTAESYLGLFKMLAPGGVLPNLTCYNDGIYGYSSTSYQKDFVNQSNVLALTELYYDYTTGTQVGYYCIDSKKAAALIMLAQTALNKTIPASTVATFTKLLKGAHFDVTYIISNQTTLSPAATTNLINGVKKSLPKFAMSSMRSFNMTGCK